MSSFLPWKVVHIDLRQPLPDLAADGTLGGIFTVLWCDNVPLGQLMIPAALLPVSAVQLAASTPQLIATVVRDRLLRNGAVTAALPQSSPPTHASELERLLDLNRPLESFSELSVSHPSEKFHAARTAISVVICTRNRPQTLEKCLSSMRTLSPAPSEIIVVDNDPASGLTPPVVAAFPEVRYIAEPRGGLSAARNAGIRNAREPLVAFTDDDVVVHPRWIGTIAKVFEDPAISATTGLILPAELSTEAQFVFAADALNWNFGYVPLDFDSTFFAKTVGAGTPVWRMGAGANMAFRRDAFERVGYFDERLGAGAAGCSEDSELWYRLLAEGHRCRYEPSAVVYHAHRPDWKGLSDQTFHYMRGHVTALLIQFQRYRHWGNLYRAFVVLPVYFVNLAFPTLRELMERLLRDPGGKRRSRSIFLKQQIRGTLGGFTYFLRHRQVPADSRSSVSRDRAAAEPAATGSR